jgi:hypothetical protein
MRARRSTPGTQTRVGPARLVLALGAVLALLAPAAASAALKTVKLITKASGSVSVGGTISDTASVIGDPQGPKPTGTVTFAVYGPDDPTCANAPAFTSGPIDVTRVTTPSGPFSPTLPGTYQFVATYTGDMVYSPATSKCNDPNEAVLVTAVTPKLTTTASPSVAVNGTITDTAVLTGGQAPTGTIMFVLYQPIDTTCAGPPVFRSTITIVDPSSVVSEPYIPPIPGTFRWRAFYSGDHTNGATSAPCNDTGESVDVTPGPGGPGGPSTPGSGPGSGGSGGGGVQPGCDVAATARAVLNGLASTLAGQPASFRSTCSAGLRIVLRAREIRPGNPGIPHSDGYTTMTNLLSHISPNGPALSFSLNSNGQALRAYALSHGQSLTAFLVVHVRPDKRSISTESLQILTLG